MEFPEVGVQCANINCKQLNFLPLKCKCGQTFCSDHFNEHAETCNKTEKDVQLKKITDLYECSEEGCNTTSIVPLICERCKKHFCIQHRHLTECHPKDAALVAAEKEKYAAPVRQFNEAKNAVDRQIQENLTKAKSKGRQEMANKVQLMRIKNKATGPKTIPTADRVYFNIFHSKQEKTQPVFVAKNWTVGRVIDAVAAECKVQNNNNRSDALKLRLFKKDTGNIISENVSDVLETLINERIIDGENLVLEYVSDGCNKLW